MLLERGEKVTGRDRLMEKRGTLTFSSMIIRLTCISRGSEKLRELNAPVSIESVRGEGYQLRALS